MPQQTKTEALEELARLIRRDILNGEAPLNGTWWFDDDTKMQDRIAHVLLDYSDEEKPTEIDVAGYNAEIDRLTEKCAALVVERDRIKAQFAEAFGEQRERAFDKMAKPLVNERDATPLRIDPDMSDPQPGKLLVVRLDGEDSYKWQIGEAPYLTRNQFIGFLVETPAVEVQAAEKCTPKIGDKVRVAGGSNDGRIGRLHRVHGRVAIVDQGGCLSFEALLTDLEVLP